MTAQASSPRAIITYVHTWSAYMQQHPGTDFLLTTFESWRRSTGHFSQQKFDLVAVTSPAAAAAMHQHATLQRVCQDIELPSQAATASGLQPTSRHRLSSNDMQTAADHEQCSSSFDTHSCRNQPGDRERRQLPELSWLAGAAVRAHSQCWLVSSPRAAESWHGYPFALNILHLVQPSFQAFLGQMQYTIVLQVSSPAEYCTTGPEGQMHLCSR